MSCQINSHNQVNKVDSAFKLLFECTIIFIKMVEVQNSRRSLVGDVGRGRAFMPSRFGTMTVVSIRH
ncbi:MAG: hypothetical protein AAFW70_24450 [Cyanobacteria bacterium J06635_10]